jgi:primosomal protein N' (replication factor Y)
VPNSSNISPETSDSADGFLSGFFPSGLPSPQCLALVLIPGGTPQAYWYDLGDLMRESLSVGQLVEVSLRNRKVVGVVIELADKAVDFVTKPILGLAPQAEKVPPAYLTLLHWLAEYYLTPLPVVLATCLPKSAQGYLFRPPKPKIKAEPKKTSSRKKKTPTLKPESASASQPIAPLTPTAEQAAAIAEIQAALTAKTYRSFLLHGITGSGKTLVYLHAAAQALAAGQKVLVLVPEIGLTPQTLSRFEAFLHCEAAAYHSNLSEGKRRALWQGLFTGASRLIIGPRSAALLPIDNLGLIVVDEEHDPSFKQDAMAPRYHARDVALWRGRQANCPVILGSATPSVETYQAALADRHRLLTLHSRATGAAPPKVTVVDMREQFKLQGHQALSIPLREALQEAIDRNEQAILFLNRRGYAPRRVCEACGEARPCERCAVPLVFHKRKNLLLCHHCGFTASPSTPCPHCGASGFVDAGRGLEQIEETLQGLYPRVKLARLDRDVTQHVGGPEAILEAFRKGDLQVLIGTQMIAKGHDFPRVGLVGVLDADAGLGLADFRAGERAFQLITQVSGRAGRHQIAGRVVLQTFNPDNPLLRFALAHDYASFFASEIVRRQDLAYPPFNRLLLIELSCPDEGELTQALTTFAGALHQPALKAELQVLGPVPAALRRLHGEWRGHILLKGTSAKRLQWAAQAARDACEPNLPKKVKLRLDMDPQSLQ